MNKKIVILTILLNCAIIAQVKINDEWFKIYKFLQKEMVNDGLDKNYEYLATEAFDNNLGKVQLKIGLEHLRIHENNEKILIRKSEFPIPDIKKYLVSQDMIRPVGINMFAGLFEIPISTLKIPKVLFASLDEKDQESNYTIGLIVSPIDNKDNTYTFRLSFVTAIKICGKYSSVWFRGQNIDMEIGEKIKIEIDHKTLGQHVNINKGINNDSTKKNAELQGMYGFHNSIHSSGDYWKIFPSIGGQTIEFTSDDKFFDGIKDFLILSFENDK